MGTGKWHWWAQVGGTGGHRWNRGGLTIHGAPWQKGIMGPLCPCPNSKKQMKKVPGASHGAPY
ncbi:unnamed protein product [Staurois parvus]|uniref:Uncharacterized protein n=1 Tax=Staurois parvus TaxID=386267 RepID=A0ABN9BKY5_9NEOB|nr:unnamed protein product [Staurois parvus]